MTENNTHVVSQLEELEELKRYVLDYNAKVSAKMDSLERDIIAFEEENHRLLGQRDGLGVERDSCVSLIARLAVAAGFKAGRAGENTVVIELPAGQITWDFEPTEAHLFDSLPTYPNPVEALDIVEKYRRVMNPGI